MSVTKMGPRVSRHRACASHRKSPGYEKQPHVLACHCVPASYPYNKAHRSFEVSEHLSLHFIFCKTAISFTILVGKRSIEKWLEEQERKKKKKEGGRITIIAMTLLSSIFFLGRRYSECQLCSTAVQQTLTSERSSSLHSIYPIELPALVINSEPRAVTVGLWTQQLATGRQALFHRGYPPISCTQLSSNPAVQSTAAAAAAQGGLFHCCHHHCPFTILSFSLLPS